MLWLLVIPMQIMAKEKVGFEAMIQSVKQDPAEVDYTALRMAWAEYEGYDPLFFASGDYKRSVEAIAEAGKSSSLADVTKLCVDDFDKYFTDIIWNSTCALAYKSLDAKENEDFHAALVLGLADSVLSSGDGRSPETAFVLVSLSEERFVLGVLRVKKLHQALVEHDGRHYDMWSAEGRKTGKKFSIYFDIERPYSVQ